MLDTGRGDRKAFAILVQRYQSRLLNYFRQLGVYSDAEDLVQETFLRLFRYRHHYSPTAKFTTFLYMLARQIRVDFFRKQYRLLQLKQDYKKEGVPEEAVAESGTNAPDIEKILRMISEDMRQVVVLNIYHGMKYREIADILGIPEGTVKTRMFHALRKLREALSGDDHR